MNVAIYRILHLGAATWPPHAGDLAAQRASIRSGLLTRRLRSRLPTARPTV